MSAVHGAGKFGPQLFSYHDYRQYLRDVIHFKKSKQSLGSLRDLANAAGVSPAYLSYVINGYRILTESVFKKILPFLELTEEEVEYLQLLILVADSDELEVRSEALGKIQKFRSYRKLNPKETEVYRYMTKWYYVAIRELAMTKGFKADPFWIKNRLCFPLSHKEIKSALSFLIRNKFIEVSESGRVKVPKKKVECKGGVYKIALGQFHKQMYSLASESIDRISRDERMIMSSTIAIAAEDFDDLKKMIEESFQMLTAFQQRKEKSKKPNSVYHIGFSGFPLAKGNKKGGA